MQKIADYRAIAERLLPDATWDFYESGADSDVTRDERAWRGFDLVPRALARIQTIDTSVRLNGVTFSSPLMIAATAAHGAAALEAEAFTAVSAATTGTLMTYSNFATTRSGALRPVPRASF